MTSRSLPSWRSGPAREAITDFLAASEQIPPARRVAVFGNDGTLWCEKPLYAQEAFFLQTLEERAADVPALHARPEYAALLDRDAAAIAAFGLPGIALALADLFDGLDPAEFAERARRFMVTTAHPTLGRPWARLVYQPMLELLAALRQHGFATFVVTGGGTEFTVS